MTQPFDLSPFEDDLAEMRREQEAIDAEVRPRQEALAEALFLLATCDEIRTHRLEALQRAETKLERALAAVLKARDDLEAASDLEIQAARAVSLLRGAAPGDLEQALANVQVHP